MKDRYPWGTFAAGLSAGVIAGFIIGLMMAPKSGTESREVIKDTIGDIDQRIKEATGDREKIYKKNWQQPPPKPYSSEFIESS